MGKENKLKLNVKKQILLLSRKRRSELDGVNVRLDGQALPRSSKVKCLGVMIDEELSWCNHIDHIKRLSVISKVHLLKGLHQQRSLLKNFSSKNEH